MSPTDYTFASDNVAGLHPQALALLSEANEGVVAAYGEDAATRNFEEALSSFFEMPVKAFLVFNGTAANALSLASLVKPYEAVACHRHAHADLDECNAPEFFTGGAKLIPIDGKNGKVGPKMLEAKLQERDDVHFPKIRALTLTLSSEVGTVYTLSELAELKEVCQKYRVRVHLDGARFFNALAALGGQPGDCIRASGADVLSLGLVKIGAALGEGVVFFDEPLSDGFAYRRKQAAQLSSKMRFISAPIPTLIKADIVDWARHANTMASSLGNGFRALGIEPVFPVEANAVFVRLKEDVAQRLRGEGWVFYDFVENTQRFVCHWGTTAQNIERLLSDVQRISASQ
ncbi:MAG: beta-eliminating lyase-related protein [Verrucomicrobiota bacterium]